MRDFTHTYSVGSYYAYALGEWTDTCCPRYLKPENFDQLRQNAREGRVVLHHGGLASAVKLRDDFTIASLLDSMDWMSDESIAGLMSEIVPRMADGGAIFWRSFSTKVHSPVLAQLHPTLVPQYDLVGWYLSQWLARVHRPAPHFDIYLLPGTAYKPVSTVVSDAHVMLQMALHALRPVKDVKAFYRAQGPSYDGFREALLPGRERLMRFVLPWHLAPARWLSVGCGTARDVEYALGALLHCKTKLTLLDLSEELLEIARDRVVRLGLTDRVTFVSTDITAVSHLAVHSLRPFLPRLALRLSFL